MQRRKAMIVLVLLALFIFVSNMEFATQIDSDSLIRIHVLANSDSQADQALKLQVKDAVVTYLKPQLEQSCSIAESRQIIQRSLPQIEQIAQQTLQQQHSGYQVTLQYGRFDYGSFSLPAGNYEALRILIGEGQGHNWWCVLFPPMCFTDNDASSSGKYTDQTPEKKVVIKFKSAELLKKWTNHEKDTKDTSKLSQKGPNNQ